MISVAELFKSQKYPKWISENPVFSKINHIRKVFPSIGLANFEDKLVIDNKKEIESFANQLLDVVADYMSERVGKLETFAKKTKRIGKKRQEQLDLITCVMRSLSKSLRNNKAAFILPSANGKVTLAIPEELKYKDTVFMKKGAGLFKIYEKLNSMLKENKFIELPNLSQAFQFKNFSSINIPAKETSVKFTSDGEEGAWDIATMSMRGIESCQKWDQGVGNGAKVIGSIIDPFTAIIYLTTSGGTATSYGARMVRRCIVRYVIDQDSKTPFLLLERMYPAFDQPSLATFVGAIKKRAPDIAVYYTTEVGEKAHHGGTKLSRSYVPISDELRSLEPRYYPYCDSGLGFKEDPTCALAKNSQGMIHLFKKRIPTLFAKAIKSSAFTQAHLKQYGAGAKLIANLRSKKGTAEDLQICNCKHASCKRNHTKIAADTKTANNAETHDANFVTELGNRFAEFVCAKAVQTDPFKFLKENKKDCEPFFIKELGSQVNDELASYLTTNIVSYIDDNNTIK